MKWRLVFVIAGGVAPVVQFLLFATYVANNPDLQQGFAQVPGGLEPRCFVPVLAPVAGLVSGGVLTAGGRVAAKIAGRYQSCGVLRRPSAVEGARLAGGPP